MSELFEIVTEEGAVVGYATRAQCHGNPSLIHQTVHVLVFDDGRNLWMQKRSISKDIQPGKWDTSVGGHMAVGEKPVESALREMNEEMGITFCENRLEFCYRYLMRNDIESELVWTFFCRIHKDEKINFNKDEITEGKFWTIQDIESCIGKNIFTPNFEQEWTKFKNTGLLF